MCTTTISKDCLINAYIEPATLKNAHIAVDLFGDERVAFFNHITVKNITIEELYTANLLLNEIGIKIAVWNYQ